MNIALDEIQFMDFYHTVMQTIRDPAVWISVGWVIAKIIIYYIAGRLVVRIAGRAVTHMMIQSKKEMRGRIHMNHRRAQTVGLLVNNVISYAVHFIVIMLILSELGVELAPLLAGAGVVGLAIGFGAQSLVKDVITGFFILLEDQFAVEDVVRVGQFQGTVVEIGLRVTRIKSFTGEVYIIPNGSITEVTNFSTSNSVSVVDISIAYEANIDRAMEVIRETALKVYERSANMVAEPQVLGVQTLGASEVVIRVTAECKPMTHTAAGRELNAAIKKALDTEGIEIPYPRLVTFQRSE